MPAESCWPFIGHSAVGTAVNPRITGDTDPLGKSVTAVTPYLVLLRPEAPTWAIGDRWNSAVFLCCWSRVWRNHFSKGRNRGILVLTVSDKVG